MRHYNLSVLISVFVAGTIGSIARCDEDYAYALFKLESLYELLGAGAISINEQGQMCGASYVSSNDSHAVIWDVDGHITDLGTLGGPRSVASDINDKGEVVGKSAFLPGNKDDEHAFLWRDGELIDLGTLGGIKSLAYGMNDYGLIVGYASTIDSGGPAKWDAGNLSLLPTLGKGGGTANGVNQLGQIVGRSWPTSGDETATLWQNGEVYALPNLGNNPSSAHAINELGWIVGQSVSRHFKTHAAAWINGRVYDLHRIDLGKESSAWGINNVGQAVGWIGDQPSVERGFLWEAGQGMQLLDKIVPPRLATPWLIVAGWDINDAGQIVATAYMKPNFYYSHALLINPVHPTMELASPTPGIAGEMNTFEVANAKPGANVVFTYSLHGGGFRIPGCDLQQNALQLDNPKIVGSAIADANGNASIERFVPESAAGKIILFQAVVVNDCAISQLVGHQFE